MVQFAAPTLAQAPDVLSALAPPRSPANQLVQASGGFAQQLRGRQADDALATSQTRAEASLHHEQRPETEALPREVELAQDDRRAENTERAADQAESSDAQEPHAEQSADGVAPEPDATPSDALPAAEQQQAERVAPSIAPEDAVVAQLPVAKSEVSQGSADAVTREQVSRENNTKPAQVHTSGVDAKKQGGPAQNPVVHDLVTEKLAQQTAQEQSFGQQRLNAERGAIPASLIVPGSTDGDAKRSQSQTNRLEPGPLQLQQLDAALPQEAAIRSIQPVERSDANVAPQQHPQGPLPSAPIVDAGVPQLTLLDSSGRPVVTADAPLLTQQAEEQAFQAAASRGLNAALRQSGGTVTLRLIPETLGALRVNLQIDGNKVALQIETSGGRAHELLTAQIATLRAGLEHRGLKVEEITTRIAPELARHAHEPATNNQQTGNTSRERAGDGEQRHTSHDQQGNHQENAGHEQQPHDAADHWSDEDSMTESEREQLMQLDNLVLRLNAVA